MADDPDERGATDADRERRWLVLEFAVPADRFVLASTLDEIANRLGISTNSTSERLGRAQTNTSE